MKGFERFLKDKYWKKEEFRKAVEESVKRAKKRGEIDRIPEKVEKQIEIYLQRFKKIFLEDDIERRKRKIQALKRFLYSRFIIKPENITDDYLKKIILNNFAELKGYTREQLDDSEVRRTVIELFEKEFKSKFEDYKVPESERKQIENQIIEDQRRSLDLWIDYLTSAEAENYPPAFRYWSFVEVLGLGSYDDTRKKYNKRTKTTAAPFPELNSQALAIVLDEIIKKYENRPSNLPLNEEQRKEFEEILRNENFNDLYSWGIEYVKSLKTPEERLKITVGEWKIFVKGSNPKDLVEAIRGFNTGWCISAEATAANYLLNSDIYVYFSQDNQGKNSIPRVAIVIRNGKITEVRGIAKNQNLDPYITQIVEDKLKEIRGGREWMKKTAHMKKLASIYLKYLQNKEFSEEDLIFLYEINEKIEGFGYSKDPRIDEIINSRNKKSDLAKIMKCKENQISFNIEEALQGNIIYHYGDINLNNLSSLDNLVFPEIVRGDVRLINLKSAKDVKFPKKIRGDFIIFSLISAENVIFPEEITDGISVPNLRLARNVKFPLRVKGSLFLSSLELVENVSLPEYIEGYIYLPKLKSAKNLTFPKKVQGDIIMSELKYAENVIFPEKIEGHLDLSNLKSAKNVELPKELKGNIFLDNLEEAENIIFPEIFRDNLNLPRLKVAKNIRFPRELLGYLNLSGLTYIENSVLPEIVNKYLSILNVREIKNVRFPREIKENLVFLNIESIEDVVLPEIVKENFLIVGLKFAKNLVFPKEVKGDLSLMSLESAENILFPEVVHGNFSLPKLKSYKNLKLPKEIKGDFTIYDLRSEDIIFPEIFSVEGRIFIHVINDEEIRKLLNKYPYLAGKIVH